MTPLQHIEAITRQIKSLEASIKEYRSGLVDGKVAGSILDIECLVDQLSQKRDWYYNKTRTRDYETTAFCD